MTEPSSAKRKAEMISSISKCVLLASILCSIGIHSSFAADAPITAPAWPAASPDAIKRWQGMRFGMFIHWGPVTLKGTEIGWSRGIKDLSIQEYDNLYKRFDPEKFNADDWVSAAKAAGMKYIVLTGHSHQRSHRCRR
jgi:hypothetical protein